MGSSENPRTTGKYKARELRRIDKKYASKLDRARKKGQKFAGKMASGEVVNQKKLNKTFQKWFDLEAEKRKLV